MHRTNGPLGPSKCHPSFGNAPSAFLTSCRLGDCAARRKKRITPFFIHHLYLRYCPDAQVYYKLSFTLQGKIATQGTPEDLINSGINFVTRVDNDSDSLHDKFVFECQTPKDVSRKSSFHSLSENTMNGNSEDVEEKDDLKQCHVASHLEKSSRGMVSGSTMTAYFKSGAHWCTVLVIFFLFLVVQFMASAADIWISIW